MSLPKYKYLVTYRLAEINFDLENEFEMKFLSGIEHRRTREQRYHASRSGKQNIMEGVSDSDTSKKSEMKLLGVSKGSFDELIGDNEDYLRQRGLRIWEKTDWKTKRLRHYVKRISDLSNLSHLGDLKERPKLPENPEVAANLLLTICHMETYLLDKQIKALEKNFMENGGFTESLYKNRVIRRRSLTG